MKASRLVWAGRALTALFAVFMIGASITPKFFMQAVVAQNMTTTGWTGDKTTVLGLLELSCLVLYLVPRTAVFGAVMMTAYLGGALATRLRVNDPLFSHTLFSVYLGLIMWGGLWLRNAGLRDIFPILRTATANR